MFPTQERMLAVYKRRSKMFESVAKRQDEKIRDYEEALQLIYDIGGISASVKIAGEALEKQRNIMKEEAKAVSKAMELGCVYVPYDEEDK